ncbi:MAG TPA: response regulator [Pyrinomonadaceae bacterium]|nr:response regulator [Pyrinomonadaceae bacterium]
MPFNTLFRVLCVDDDLDACEMLSALLKAYRMEVTCAHSAVEAWPLIKAECFDLYLLDGWLPGLDGFEFCRQIRKFDSITPILFYSGAAYDADKRLGIASGANAYVAKPDVEGLIKTITHLIAKAKAGHFAAAWAGSRQIRTNATVNFPPSFSFEAARN